MVLFSSFSLIFYGQGKGSPHMGKITAHVSMYQLKSDSNQHVQLSKNFQ